MTLTARSPRAARVAAALLGCGLAGCRARWLRPARPAGPGRAGPRCGRCARSTAAGRRPRPAGTGGPVELGTGTVDARISIRTPGPASTPCARWCWSPASRWDGSATPARSWRSCAAGP